LTVHREEIAIDSHDIPFRAPRNVNCYSMLERGMPEKETDAGFAVAI
jgi:hypothetical protein